MPKQENKRTTHHNVKENKSLINKLTSADKLPMGIEVMLRELLMRKKPHKYRKRTSIGLWLMALGFFIMAVGALVIVVGLLDSAQNYTVLFWGIIILMSALLIYFIGILVTYLKNPDEALKTSEHAISITFNFAKTGAIVASTHQQTPTQVTQQGTEVQIGMRRQEQMAISGADPSSDRGSEKTFGNEQRDKELEHREEEIEEEEAIQDTIEEANEKKRKEDQGEGDEK